MPESQRMPRRLPMADLQQPESEPLGLSYYAPDDQVALELASIVKFMREDPDNMVFRRFERLNLYNLLSLQHRLLACDKEISTCEEDWNGPALAEILPKLEALMKSYNEAILAQDQMRKLQSTPEHLTSTLKNHAFHCLKQLKHELDPEEGWLELFSLDSKNKELVHKFIDSNSYLSRLFLKPGTQNPESGLFYYSERGVRLAEETIVNAGFCILVLAPVFALSFITSQLGKLFLVLGCVLLASFASSVLSDRFQKSNLALVAGYTAVLVVFLGTPN